MGKVGYEYDGQVRGVGMEIFLTSQIKLNTVGILHVFGLD